MTARGVDGVFRGLSKRTSTYEARDGRLAAQAPVMLIVQLGLWLLLFGGGFTLLLWAVDDHGVGRPGPDQATCGPQRRARRLRHEADRSGALRAPHNR